MIDSIAHSVPVRKSVVGTFICQAKSNLRGSHKACVVKRRFGFNGSSMQWMGWKKTSHILWVFFHVKDRTRLILISQRHNWKWKMMREDRILRSFNFTIYWRVIFGRLCRLAQTCVHWFVLRKYMPRNPCNLPCEFLAARHISRPLGRGNIREIGFL